MDALAISWMQEVFGVLPRSVVIISDIIKRHIPILKATYPPM